jgi:hypothetical protein
LSGDSIPRNCHLCHVTTGLEKCIVCGYFFCKDHMIQHKKGDWWGPIAPELIVV